jgi:hypothetical protein
LADSAYTASATVIPAFKQSPGQQLPADKKDFNYTLSHHHVEVKHCIGMLKNRWQSLKCLRHLILGVRSARQVNRWIQTCIILHNFMLSEDSDWELLGRRRQDTCEAGEDAEPKDDLDETHPDATEDTRLRTRLFEQFCASAMA